MYNHNYDASPIFNTDFFEIKKDTANAQCNDWQSDSSNIEKKEAITIGILRLVLAKTDLYKLFQNHAHDPRHGKCIYSAASLLMIMTLMYILRFPSRNGFHDAAVLSQVFNDNMAKLGYSGALPCSKTFEDLFMQLDCCDLEPVLPALFRWLLRSKFFVLHPEFKGETAACDKKAPFTIAIDGQVIHTYHEHNQHPCANCPYCLKRTHGDAVWYIHYDVVLSVIGEHGFQMPLFVYRIQRAQQVEKCSDSELKQECELSSLPHLLQQFRNEFPRLSVTLLLDALYSNGPALSVVEKYHCGYTIVRKSGSLKSLNTDLNGLKKLITPLGHTSIVGRWKTEQQAYIFHDMSHQDHHFNMIDLSEKCQLVASSRFAKITAKSGHWQWIVSQTVYRNNVFKIIHQARLRWHQEDFFNTIQKRGFNLLHDFSRHPTSQSIWHVLLLIAFSISMLMQISRLGCLSRCSASMISWIKYLYALLMTKVLDNLHPPPQQLRFFCCDIS